MTAPPLVVVAYAVAPGPGGAEAEVNAHFAEALARWWPSPVTVITAGNAPVETLEGGERGQVTTVALGECGELGDPAPAFSRIAARCLMALRSDRIPVSARVINRLTYWTTGQGVKYAWRASAAEALRTALDRHPDAVVYSRALPIASIDAVRAVRRRRTFPWIVNINDPLPASLWPGQYPVDMHGNRRADAILRRAIPSVSAFTFSSPGLRRIELDGYPAMGAVPSLILPHVPPADGAVTVAPCPARETGRLDIVFTGTLRGNRVRREFFDGLHRFAASCPQDARAIRIRLLVPVLNERLAQERQGLDAMLEIRVAPGAEAIATACSQADVLLDLESEADAPLLMAKLARYVGCRKPVWAVCEGGGNTSQLVRDHGWGYETPFGDTGAVADTLRRIHGDWRAGLLDARRPAPDFLDLFSAGRMVQDLQTLCAEFVAPARAPQPLTSGAITAGHLPRA